MSYTAEPLELFCGDNTILLPAMPTSAGYVARFQSLYDHFSV